MRVLREGRTIKSGNDAVELVQNGKMAGRLGGKRFLPQWIQDDTKTFQDLVGLTLDTIGPDPNVAGDEAIQFMIKCSTQGPEKWLAVIENNPDTIVELSRAFTAQWFKSPEWEEKRQKLITTTEYVASDWHNMEKDIQEYRAARQAKKGKAVTNVNLLYDTLYDDGAWKLFTPKCFEGDVELASHMYPFGSVSEPYTKARWCTATDKRYYETYTNKGVNKLYVIQRWIGGKYKGAWQIAFDDAHIEFMDKNDDPHYETVKRAPKELLEKIICDHPSCRFFGFNLAELFKLLPEGSHKINNVFNTYTRTIIRVRPDLFKKIDNYYLNNSGALVYFADVADDDPSLNELRLTNEVKTFLDLDWDSERQFDKYKKIYVPKSLDGQKLPFGSHPLVESIEFEEGYTVIPRGCLTHCDKLREVKLPSTLKKIGENAFYNTTSLVHIDLPVGLETIEGNAFKYTGLVEVTIPETVTHIGNYAFSRNENLIKAILPKKVLEVGYAIFENCLKLEYCENFEQLLGIDRSFSGCNNLDLGDLLSTVDRIPAEHFERNTEISEVVLKDNIKTIGSRAFIGSSITKFVADANLEVIEGGAFSRCKSLKVVDLSKATKLTTIQSEAFYNSGIETIILPSSVVNLGRGAFENCVNLKSIDLGDSLRILNKSTFESCENLTDVKLPSTLRQIGRDVFKYCKSLTHIDFPPKLFNIGEDAFSSTGLIELHLPKRLARISLRCFARCKELTKVEFSTNLSEVGYEAFEYCEKLTKLVPYGDLEDYDLKDEILFTNRCFAGTPLNAEFEPLYIGD